MLCTGIVAAAVGLALAPTLAHGNSTTTFGYRLLFVSCPLSFIGQSYLFALQGRSIHRWLIGRAIQPVAYLLLVAGLKFGSGLTFRHIIEALVSLAGKVRAH
jgi:hypothetical protein